MANYFVKHSRIGAWLKRRRNLNTMRILREYSVSKVLEMGPGQGDLARVLLDAGHRYRYHTINKGEADYLQSELRICNLSDCTLEWGQWDAVVSEHVLEHCEDPVAAVRGWAKHLIFGGILVLRVPTCRYGMAAFLHSDYTHVFLATQARVKRLIEDETDLEILRLSQNYKGIPWPWFLPLVPLSWVRPRTGAPEVLCVARRVK